jgi:hypothetical protein
MSSVGSLEIQLMANIARLSSDMQSAQRTVGGAMSNIERTVNAAKKVFVGLAAGLSVRAFGSWISGAIDAADQASKLGQQIGVSTSQVAGLQLAFTQSGMSATQMVPLMSKLNVAIANGSKAFDAMGLSGRAADGSLKVTRQLLGEVADKFAGYENGAAKTALAVGLLGEEGAKLLPLLNGGAQALDDYDAMAKKLGLTISDSTGKAAERFNDTLDLVGQSTQGMARQIAAQLLPTLSGLADNFFTAMTEGDKLKNTADFLANSLKVLYIGGMGIVEVFSTVGSVLGGTAAIIVAALSGDFKGAAAIFDAMKKDVGDGWTATAKQMTDAWHTTGSAGLEAMATLQKTAKATAPALADLEAQTKANAEAAKKAAKALEDMHKAGDAAAKARQDIVTKERDGIHDWMTAQDEAYAAAVKGSQEAVIAAKAEVEQYGMTASQIAEITLLTMESSRAKYRDGAAGLEALEKQIAAQKELIGWMRGREVLDANKKVNDAQVAEQKKTIEQIDDIFRTGFAGMVNGGENAWAAFTKSLATTFKTTVADAIYKTFAQPFVVKIVASVLGITGAGAANAAGTGSSLLSGASTASSLMGGASAFGGAFSAGAAVGTEAFSAGLTMMTQATGASSFMAGAGQALGAIGPVGWAALAAVAVLSLRSSKISAANTGDASLTTDANGNAINLGSINGLSQQTAGLAAGMQASYATAARALGITLAQTNFATGSNSGRQGANPNLAFASTVNGNSFQSGEISAADSAAVSLAAARAVFSALKSSTLPEYLAGAFDGITASTATQEQITAALAGAQALATFHNALTALPFERLASLSYEATQALIAYSGGLDALAANLGTYYTNFFSDEEQRAQKIININAATLGSGLDAATATRESFRALVEAQDLTTASGQQTYAALLAVSGAFAGITPAAVQATLAVDKVSVAVIDMAQLAAEAAKTAVSDAMSGLGRAVDAERNRITDVYQSQAASINASLMTVGNSISQLQTLAGTLKSTLDGMRIAGSTTAYRTSAQDEISAALAQARSGGGLPLAGELDSALRTVAQPSEQLFGSFEDYARDFYKTANDISALADLTQTALTADQTQQQQMTNQLAALERYHAGDMAQLDSLISTAQAQLDAANRINNSVISVSAALSGLSQALYLLASSQAAVPAFAGGGIHTGGLRIVGERGPELEATGPSRIFNASQTRSLLSGGNDDMVAELRALRIEVAGLRASSDATAAHTNKTARLIDRAMPSGTAIAVETVTA